MRLSFGLSWQQQILIVHPPHHTPEARGLVVCHFSIGVYLNSQLVGYLNLLDEGEGVQLFEQVTCYLDYI